MKLASVILAAGMGTRMASDLPKVMHPLNGRPMICYAVETAAETTGNRPLVVVGHGAERVRSALGESAGYVLQQEQKGTGHAVQQAETALRGRADAVLVTFGDMPLLTGATLRRLVTTHQEGSAVITMLTIVAEDPRGFGRIVRSPGGQVLAIVEEAVATPEQLAIRELNASAYVFSSAWLWDALHRIEISPRGEYYLTDLVEIANLDGLGVQAIRLANPDEAIGINTPDHLREAERLLLLRNP